MCLNNIVAPVEEKFACVSSALCRFKQYTIMIIILILRSKDIGEMLDLGPWTVLVGVANRCYTFSNK